jgi:hypothetical protein
MWNIYQIYLGYFAKEKQNKRGKGGISTLTIMIIFTIKERK